MYTINKNSKSPAFPKMTILADGIDFSDKDFILFTKIHKENMRPADTEVLKAVRRDIIRTIAKGS